MADDSLKQMIEVINEGVEYINRVLPLVDDVCNKLRKSEGIINIAQISEGFMAIIKIVDYTKDITKIEFNGDVVADFISDMMEGMENGDYNLVADIIEYEIKPLYEQWEKAFSKVIDENA